MRITQREIPEELHEIAKLMRKSGSSIKDVENFLRVKVTSSGDTAAFTYDDVRHLVGATTAQRAWDATDFIEQLEERRKLRGLFCKFSLDADGRLENAFFVMDGALEIYAAGGRCNVLVFDTKHGTNTHKLKLGCFKLLLPAAQQRSWLPLSLPPSPRSHSHGYSSACWRLFASHRPSSSRTVTLGWLQPLLASSLQPCTFCARGICRRTYSRISSLPCFLRPLVVTRS